MTRFGPSFDSQTGIHIQLEYFGIQKDLWSPKWLQATSPNYHLYHHAWQFLVYGDMLWLLVTKCVAVYYTQPWSCLYKRHYPRSLCKSQLCWTGHTCSVFFIIILSSSLTITMLTEAGRVWDAAHSQFLQATVKRDLGEFAGTSTFEKNCGIVLTCTWMLRPANCQRPFLYTFKHAELS